MLLLVCLVAWHINPTPIKPKPNSFTMPSRSAGGRGAHHAQQQQGGQGQGQRRGFSRPKDAKVSRACRFYFGPSGCRRGDRCHFSHDALDDPAKYTNRNSSNNSNDKSTPPKDEGASVSGNGGGDGTSPTTVVDSTPTSGSGKDSKGRDSSGRKSNLLSKSRRRCKFGADCRHRHPAGHCPYEHPQDYNTPAVAGGRSNDEEEDIVEELEEEEMPPAAAAERTDGVASPPLPPSSWVAGNGNGNNATANASLPNQQQPQQDQQPQQEFAYRRYSSPTPDTNPYSARTDLESLLLQSMVVGMGALTGDSAAGTADTAGNGTGADGQEQQQQLRERKSSKEQLLMASLGLTSSDLHLAVHGSAAPPPSGVPTHQSRVPTIDQTIEHVNSNANANVRSNTDEVKAEDGREEYMYDQNEEEMEGTAAYYTNNNDNEESAATTAAAAATAYATPAKSTNTTNSTPTRTHRSLLSPITLAEADHNLAKLSTLSQSWDVSNPSSGNQHQMEEFNAALQMCRSVQMTVVEVLQRATMMTTATTTGMGEEEEQLTQLLELNESLLSTIAHAEQSLVDAREGAAASRAKAEAETERDGLARGTGGGGIGARQQQQQRRAGESNDVDVDPAEAMGLPRGYLTQLTPEEYEALDKRDAEEAYFQKYGRTKEQDFGPSAERLAELAEAERWAEAERKLAQKLGLAPTEGKADGSSEAPKKAKKKRIRKKKDKGTVTADANDADAAANSKPKAATHTPEELAKIKAKELEATRRAEAAAAEAAERAKQDERDRLARMREEARKQQAAARERKKAKKVQKYQRKVAEQVEAEAVRTKVWAEERAKSKDRTGILQSLCITELIRQSSAKVMGLSFSRVQEDDSAMTSIRDVSTKAYQELYKYDIKRRVVIAGVDTTGGGSSNGKKDLNGRHGTILFYDETKGEYSVALDTKKGKQDVGQTFKPENLDVAEDGALDTKKGKQDVGQTFKPENLDVAEDGAASTVHAKNSKSNGMNKGKKNGPGAKGHNVDHSYGIFISSLLSYGGVSLDLEYFLVSQSDVAGVEKASTLDAGLRAFSAKRNEDERIQKLLEEEERAREAEERERRAELRAREEEERRRRQAEKEREREEMLEFLRKQKERMAAGDEDDSDEGHHHRRQYYESDEEDYYDDDDDYGYGESCDCAQCRMRARMQDYIFMSMFVGMRGGGMGPMPHPIFMSMFGGMGGMPFGPGMGGFYGEDDDDDEYYEEEDDEEDDFFKRFFFGGGFDDAYEEREAQRRQEENEEQAEILGVPVDADAKTIKTKCKFFCAHKLCVFPCALLNDTFILTNFTSLPFLFPTLQIVALLFSIIPTSGARTATTA